MDSKKIFYPESRFGGFTDIDGTIIFYARVNSLIDSSSVVLDMGCGRGRWNEDEVLFRKNLRILRNKCEKVIGVDIDKSATEVWSKLVKKPDRFISISTEDLFGNLDIVQYQELADWWDYISTRYRWVKECFGGAS